MIQANEQWLDIEGCEGMYQISSFGNVKSLARGNRKEKLLKKCTDRKGYLFVCLYKENKATVCKVHQLVAVAFLNHTPNGMANVVDHIDNNKLNNNVSNLQIISNRRNIIKSRVNQNGYVGVYTQGSKWQAAILVDGKKHSLGYFDSPEKAAERYQEALYNVESLLKSELLEYLKSCIRVNTSKYRGVSFNKNCKKWEVCLYDKFRKKIYLGRFHSEEEAFQRLVEYNNNLKQIKI